MIALAVPMLAATMARDSCRSAVPLREGAAWTYAGSALWSGGGASKTDSGAVAWTMAIIAARDTGDTRVALVRGFVTQLAWYEPGTRPRLSLLACHLSRLYSVEPASDSAAQDAYVHWSDGRLQAAEVLLELPLHDGQLFGQSPPRNDDFYGWAVAAVPPAHGTAPPAGCGSGRPQRFDLTYRSLPDHTIIEWQPGLGVTHYTYGHHGTPAATDVRLAGCSRSR